MAGNAIACAWKIDRDGDPDLIIKAHSDTDPDVACLYCDGSEILIGTDEIRALADALKQLADYQQQQNP